MAEAKSFECPKCGSALTPDGDEKEIKCAFCGSTVIVPEDLRDDELDEDEELSPEEDLFSPQHVQWLIQTGTDAMFKVDIINDRQGETRNMKPVVNLYLSGKTANGEKLELVATTNVPRNAIPRRGTMIKIKYNPANIAADFALQLLDGQFYYCSI
jgi:DNA-directed RNA polymerase subunit RPC12/RpoP